ncbi:hypothetical protein WJX72_011324 [[Myrmecia] bisecta]|uniref:Pectin acetylesterase n=1 Tax=[Myrmecia] bisecta TaxID=41462 RepID=A0AAW1P6N9_9CHLO
MALVVLSLLAAALCLSTYRSRLVWPRWHPGVGLPPPDLSMEPQTAAEQRWRFNMRRYNTTDVDPQAVCNDGSPGVFFFRPALSMHSTKWVVRFHGGAWCWDKLSCEQRWRDSPHLMSTTMLPPDAVNETCPVRDIQLHGIMSMHPEENPAFYGWNQVYVWYCSSDSHLGDAPEGFTDETGEWHFRGKRITAAVFTTLLQRENLAAATDVLVSGDSAGGVAALNNAAFIHDIVAPRAHGIQRFKAFIDAGWFLDVPNYSGNPGAFSFRKCAQSLVTNYNASFDRSCTAHFPDEPWRCFHAQYAWRHVKFPVLFHEFLYDSANLGFDTCYKQADVEDFRHRLRAIDTLPWSGDTGHVKISGSYKQRADTLRLVAEAEMETLSEGAWHGPQPRQAGTPGRAGRAGKARSAGAARRLLGESGGDDESDIVAEAVAADEEYHSMPSMPEGQSVPQHDASAAPLASHASEGPSGRSTAQHGTTADAEPATGSADTAPDTHALQIFAPACHLHEITDTNFFMASHIGGQFLFDVLTEWFYRDTGRPLQLVDQHSGIRDDRECLKALHQQPPSSKR